MFDSHSCLVCSACYLHVYLKYISSAYNQIAPTRYPSCPTPGAGWSLWDRLFTYLRDNVCLISVIFWVHIIQSSYTTEFAGRPAFRKIMRRSRLPLPPYAVRFSFPRALDWCPVPLSWGPVWSNHVIRSLGLGLFFFSSNWPHLSRDIRQKMCITDKHYWHRIAMTLHM